MKYAITYVLILLVFQANALSILLPMDESQRNHLKAYGIAFHALKNNVPVNWLLNYRGGSFLLDLNHDIYQECLLRGVTVEKLTAEAVNSILLNIESPSVNQNLVNLQRAPRIAVYSPKNEFILDNTDAVINVLEFAEIPYTIIYDEEILNGGLASYDWLHLHHEDFTGQNGKNPRRESVRLEAEIQRATAQRLGYTNVSLMKLEVAKRIKAFCSSGGYLFAMCSGAETFDIALSAEGIDLESLSYIDDPADNNSGILNFSKTLAFENFTLEPSGNRQFSDINTGRDYYGISTSYFSLFEFSAKWDIIASILTQNHEIKIREFHGQTTAFNKLTVKPTALILGQSARTGNVRYLYGEIDKGHWTFYSGHDPEGSHARWREAADLNQYPNSPGYRLILNNVLFPSARRKKQKT